MPVSTTCKPVSVYRLEGGRELADYLGPVEDDVLFDGPVIINGIEGRQVLGTRETDRPAWADQVESLTGLALPELAGRQPWTVVLLPVGEWTFALTFGGAHHLLNDELVDQSFGLSYAIRRLDADRLGTVARAALDATARQIQTSFPGGGDLGAFGLEPYGEMVTRVAGSADLSDLTYGRETRRKHQIRAARSLNLPMSSSPAAFTRDLETLTTIVDEPDEHSALRFWAQTRPLGKRHPLLPDLERRLAKALGGDADAGPLGFAWPHNAIREAESADSFKLRRAGRSPVVFTREDGLEAIVGRLSLLNPRERIRLLRDASVTPCEDVEGQYQLRNQIALRKWISFETEIDHSTYCYHQGEWYRIGEQFVEQIRSQVAELLTHRADLDLPTWVPTGKQDDEHRYCELVAEQAGFVCLDRDLAKTPFNRRLELGDLLGPGDQLIHVKWLFQATAASHLFVQAGSASWSLRAEPEALEQLRAKVRAADPERELKAPSSVVLAVAGRPWTVEKLFTLSQIGLLRLNAEARFLDTKLEFAEIPFLDKKTAKQMRENAA
ncbi:MAG TPA: TIGR04141 family sporadically distributed protein [Amycolatopsis sp.]|uniref:TIGR04141 family sporadically distributed protein n=1 Tax=Amycolatopsis nalaikhensis TaxID=715472 RepID=A0ABY8XED8_9PSEU|nr:TIGR04141 family sporadically distributed protein [Amycolatopsis sp. 2-2]WIV53975.1 TIGR04141 family sporadically distributed protein [Amycolatopsis sp. 2-2]HWD02743.1 TIGR04141 family sporadically distributed protein [Amycolatopsis sp.]